MSRPTSKKINAQNFNVPHHELSKSNLYYKLSTFLNAYFDRHLKIYITFVRSVAVHSMKTFLVLSVIFEWSPLIIGGMDKTIPFLSLITG